MSTITAEKQENSVLASLGDALEAAAESIGDARSSASEQAEIAARKVKSGVSAGAYHAAYGLSFGVVFGAVFLKELLPESSALRRGFEEGAEAAIDAIAVRKGYDASAVAEKYEEEEPDEDVAPRKSASRARKTVTVAKKRSR
jgi:hypothetical protein